MAEGNGGLSMPNTLYMVIEQSKNKDAVSVYRRFRECGRPLGNNEPHAARRISSKLKDRTNKFGLLRAPATTKMFRFINFCEPPQPSELIIVRKRLKIQLNGPRKR